MKEEAEGEGSEWGGRAEKQVTLSEDVCSGEVAVPKGTGTVVAIMVTDELTMLPSRSLRDQVTGTRA